MKLNLLNKEELTNLYKDEMMFDFPRAELKPLRAMLRLMDMGQYDPLLVTDDQGVALGYAMIWLPRVRPIIRRGGGPHLGRPGGE